MRHFAHLSEQDRQRLFFVAPESFTSSSPKSLLASALGATLYIPAIRAHIIQDLRKMSAKGAASVVICLEDSISDEQVPLAEDNLARTLALLACEPDTDDLPLIFVRVRTPEHLSRIAQRNEDYLYLLTGFVFPKFEDATGCASSYTTVFEDIIQHQSRAHGNDRPLYFMPVLESALMVYRETRDGVISGIKSVLDRHHRHILAVRLGTTDMSSPYALRRSRDLTIYNVHVVASVIADVVNYLGRAEDGYIITGSVWEHYPNRERLFKPQLRETPFLDADDAQLRRKLLMQDLDGLIREIEIDRANGLLGKTVIHPTHIALVNSMSVVSHEEYSDACDILSREDGTGGASASAYRNKMNEQKPHLNWAKKTLLRAQAFGVAAPEITFVELLEASMPAV